MREGRVRQGFAAAGRYFVLSFASRASDPGRGRDRRLDLRSSAQSIDPLRRILVARGLRAFGDGYISLLLPVYLLSLGFSAFDVGIIATATLFGSGALT